MVKFDRSDVQDILDVGHVVVLTITGKLHEWTKFTGTYTIRVIDPPEMVPLGPEAKGFTFVVRECHSEEDLFMSQCSSIVYHPKRL
ncbi:MAG: hypothetical protein KAW09_07515, partial [Thermoplasmata archaeon]|nr:hypothetical protein [Thermoplasmata archaeon]